MQETEMSHEQAKELMRKLVRDYENQISSLRSELEQQNRERQSSQELDALKDNPYYDDIDEVRGEVLSYANEHSVSPREAYGALFAEKKAKEAEQKKKKIGALSQEGNAGDDGDFEEGVLSRDEYWAAKKAGISLADYLKFKNR